MQKNLVSTFNEVQRVHALGFVKDVMQESATVGQLSLLLKNTDIMNMISDIPLSEVFTSKSLRSLHAQRVGKPRISISPGKRNKVKAFLVQQLVKGHKFTSELSFSARENFGNIPRNLVYALLNELEQTNRVVRVENNNPILWGFNFQT